MERGAQSLRIKEVKGYGRCRVMTGKGVEWSGGALGCYLEFSSSMKLSNTTTSLISCLLMPEFGLRSILIP
jgi:hypothetical protein